MPNSGKIWDLKEVYNKERNSSWSKGDIGVSTNTTGPTVEKVQISTAGNAAAFGDISTSGNEVGGAMAGNQTRLLMGGGAQPNTSNVICYKEFSFDGNFQDFGDLSVDRQLAAGASNGLRAAFVGGRQADGGPYTTSNRMDVSTFASLGNAVDFGDLTVARFSLASMQSPTRGVFAGGSPSPSNTIDFITWSSLGNAIDFGDIGTTTIFAGFGGSSSETRGVFGGGGNASNASIINFVTMASQGNSGDFGNLSVDRLTNSAAGNSNRVCFFGGQEQPSTNASNVIDFVTISTLGNATDFGDLTSTSGFKCNAHSNGHGGIGLGEFQRPSATYMPGSGRALMVSGESPASPYNSTAIDMLMIPTLGNSSDFGDVTVDAGYGLNGTSNVTRGLIGGGYVHPAANNSIRSVEIASQGNTFDFGNLSVARYYLGTAANTTRCLWGAGDTGSISDVVDYKTFASAGNASDFGNLTVARGGTPAGCSSPTRATFGGGQTSPAVSDVIDYVTIGSTGNATDFGNLSVARQALGGTSSATRGLMAGGITPSLENTIDYITIASTGNATDFGNLTVARHSSTGVSNNTRGVFMGGLEPAYGNTMDYVTIASTGNAADFGDLFVAHSRAGNATDNHGGLQSA